MKKISLLVLVCLVFLLCLTSCSIFMAKEQPDDAHEHAFSTEWSTSATEHWHAATCEHADEKSDVASHSDAGEDGVCDVCKYVIFELHTVTVTADEVVTLSNSTLSVKAGADATFTATVSDKYVLTASGAEIVGEPTTQNGAKVYTFKVAAVSADASVTISAEQKAIASLIVSGEGSFGAVEAFTYASSPITFNAPAAGTYYIFGTDGVEFGLADSEDSSWVYQFTAEAAGELELVAKYFSWETLDDLTYEYSIVSVDDVLLPAGEGEGYVLPTFETIVKITAPTTPGLYWVGADLENMVWNGYMGYGCFVNVKEGDEYVEITVELADAGDALYELNYTVTVLADVIIVEGDNDIEVLLGNYTKVTFTATTAGAYIISCIQSDSGICAWDDEYNDMVYQGASIVTKMLAAGETITCYITNYYSETDVEEIVNVTYAGFVLDDGENTVSANGAGVPVSFINSGNWEDRTYLITAGDNAKLGFIDENGEIVYVDSKEILIPDGANVSFVVATVDGTDADVTVSIEHVVYEIYLELGENTLELKPGVEYTVYSDYLAYYGEYVLVFDGSVVSITSWGEPIESDVTNQWFGTLTFSLVGDTTATVTVTLNTVVEEVNELVLGENSIYVTIENYFASEIESVFTASTAGTYVLSAADGEHNALILVDGLYSYEEIELPYEFTLEADESITFYITSLADVMTETEDYVDLFITKQANENTLVLGENSVYVTIENYFANTVEMTFTATVAGTYVLSAADGEENANVYIEDMYGSEMIDLPYEFTLEAGESFTFLVSTSANIMTETEDYIDLTLTKKETVNELVLGDNSIDVVVTNFYPEQTMVTFTATEAGTYTLAAAEGEENADVYFNDEWIEELPYEFTLAAGESIVFGVATLDIMLTEDTIDLVITKIS